MGVTNLTESVFSFISSLNKRQLIAKSDSEYAYLLTRLDPSISVEQLSIFIATIHYYDKGHTAIDQEMLDDFLTSINVDQAISIEDMVSGSPLVGEENEFKPFIYWNDLLYLQKSFNQERELAEWLIEKSKSDISISDSDKRIIKENYNSINEDLQKRAIVNSFTKSLLFITGGPGTGKTYTVQQIIKAHRKIFGDSYMIKVAAPTGKAAQRINNSLDHNEDSEVKAETIHQLLGATNTLGGFRINGRNQLVADLVIIDEASMMDLGLWSALTKGISSYTRLIVVGDPYQLASVEAGSVLNDICSVELENEIGLGSLNQSIIILKARHRYASDSGINQFADAINRMDVETAFKLLNSDKFDDVQWAEPSLECISDLVEKYSIRPVLNDDENSIHQHRILTAIRNGQFGCAMLNEFAEKNIKHEINVSQSVQWYENRVIMANKNNYQLGVQNGEIGIYEKSTEHIVFSNQKRVQKNLLQDYEVGYCITVHKSQGSEYDCVAIVLPDKPNPILSKELLYTAVTRARKSVLVLGSSEILTFSIANKTKRKSGLIKQFSSLLG